MAKTRNDYGWYQTGGKPPLQAVVAKTANYTVDATDLGTLFTNTGAAGAVTFTLPLLSTLPPGWWCDFFVAADQSVTVQAETVTDHDTMVVFNDAAADSIAFSTAGEKIGNGLKCTVNADATKWLVRVNLGTETSTPTIAT